MTITAGDQRFELNADRGGVIDEMVDIQLPPGWNELLLQVGDEEPVPSKVFVVSANQDIGVVCDIDDTVMVTALPRPLLAAWQRFEEGWFAVDGTRDRCDLVVR